MLANKYRVTSIYILRLVSSLIDMIVTMNSHDDGNEVSKSNVSCEIYSCQVSSSIQILL